MYDQNHYSHHTYPSLRIWIVDILKSRDLECFYGIKKSRIESSIEYRWYIFNRKGAHPQVLGSRGDRSLLELESRIFESLFQRRLRKTPLSAFCCFWCEMRLTSLGLFVQLWVLKNDIFSVAFCSWEPFDLKQDWGEIKTKLQIALLPSQVSGFELLKAVLQ